MKKKKAARKPKKSAAKAPAKKPLDELSPEDLEKVAGGVSLFDSNGRPRFRRVFG